MSWEETCQSFRGTCREEVSSAEIYVGYAQVAKENEVCKRRKVLLFCGTGWLWVLLVLAYLYSCPRVFVGGFPDFLWSPFFVTSCCPSVAQSHLEVGDVSVNFWYRCARLHGIMTRKMSCFFTAVETLDLADSCWLPCACTK